MIRIAILDLYDAYPNQGMRCLREIINTWGEHQGEDVAWDEFDVRKKNEVPDLSYDIYISSGGPGSPVESEGWAWEQKYFAWVKAVEAWNADPQNVSKKSVFFICHSFEIMCRWHGIAEVSKRKSTSFGVFPVHVLKEGQRDPVFQGLKDPFYVVDSRDWQVVNPRFDIIEGKGFQVLCIEKYRPHVPLPQALMGVRFNEYMVGTQFHPEADAIGMSMYLQTEEKKSVVIAEHGQAKWESMIEGLADPFKIMWTHDHMLYNFLTVAARQLVMDGVAV